MYLHDCVFIDSPESELFILGSSSMYEAAKVGRDRRTQALLRIDDTIDCGAGAEEMLDNEECKALISALGIGIQVEPDTLQNLGRLRYRRLIFITDQSQVGLHVRDEVSRYLYTYSRQVLDAGHVWVPQSHLEPGFSQEDFELRILSIDTRRLKVVIPEESLEATLARMH